MSSSSSSRFLVLAFAVAMALAVGCKHDDNDMDHHDGSMKGSTDKAAMMDACPHCPGVQTATAAGKCPVCGADVKPMPKSPAGGTTSASSPDATAASVTVDACTHCPGVQTATAEGKCPVCGAQVVQKK